MPTPRFGRPKPVPASWEGPRASAWGKAESFFTQWQEMNDAVRLELSETSEVSTACDSSSENWHFPMPPPPPPPPTGRLQLQAAKHGDHLHGGAGRTNPYSPYGPDPPSDPAKYTPAHTARCGAARAKVEPAPAAIGTCPSPEARSSKAGDKGKPGEEALAALANLRVYAAELPCPESASPIMWEAPATTVGNGFEPCATTYLHLHDNGQLLQSPVSTVVPDHNWQSPPASTVNDGDSVGAILPAGVPMMQGPSRCCAACSLSAWCGFSGQSSGRADVEQCSHCGCKDHAKTRTTITSTGWVLNLLETIASAFSCAEPSVTSDADIMPQTPKQHDGDVGTWLAPSPWKPGRSGERCEPKKLVPDVIKLAAQPLPAPPPPF